jgi:hypothetical protein
MSANDTNDVCSCCFQAKDIYEQCMPPIIWGTGILILVTIGGGIIMGAFYLMCVLFGLMVMPAYCRGRFAGCTKEDIWGMGFVIGLPIAIVFLCSVVFIWYVCVRIYHKYYHVARENDTKYEVINSEN